MPEGKSRRGRPKGSGIDDSERLQSIADLMRRDPALKPTTAIKAIGVTDPSAIRRLRDKFQECRPELLGQRAPRGRTPAAASAGTPAMRSAAPISAMPEAPPRAATPVSAVPAVHLQTVAAVDTGDPKAWLAVWYGLGIRAMGAAIEAQLSLMQQAMCMPHVAAAVRHQLVVGEMAMTLCLPPSRARVLH